MWVRRATTWAAVAVLAATGAGCSSATEARSVITQAAPSISWSACQGSVPQQYRAKFAKLECGQLQVPLDYSKPDGTKIALGMVRAKATGDRLGSLLFNFGGPGGAGVSSLVNRYLTGSMDTLNTRYDLVSFDPRGVGLSDPVACLGNADDEKFLLLDHTPQTDAQVQAYTAGVKGYTDGCEANSGALLPHIGTVTVAKDMDTIRQALGEDKLNYFGISYGTWLGGVYAHQFPDRVGRTVLDSAVDPTLSPKDLDIQQAQAIEANLNALLDGCVAQGSACPLHPYGTTRAALRAAIAAYSAKIDTTPAKAGTRTLSQQMFLLGLGSAVGAASERATVTKALAAGLGGDPTGLIALADGATSRNPDGTYDNEDEVNRMVRCADTTTHYSIADIKAQVPAFTAGAPIFGVGAAWDGLRCLDWPYAGDDAAKNVSAPNSATTIVVIGSTGDPETPYVWSQAFTRQLGNAQLITNNGPYHSAYFSGAACVEQKTNAYLFNGTLPGTTTCG